MNIIYLLQIFQLLFLNYDDKCVKRSDIIIIIIKIRLLVFFIMTIFPLYWPSIYELCDFCS